MSKDVSLRRLRSDKQALRASQTRIKSNAICGEVKSRAKTICPRIGKLATAKKGEKGKCKGGPDHGEIPEPQPTF